MVYSLEHMPERRGDEFNTLMRQELKVGRAWAVKRRCVDVYPASG
jgi:hypothetical protein